MKKRFRLLFSIIMTAVVFFTQSMFVFAESEANLLDSKTKISLLGKYDSADTAAVKQINTYSGTIQFRNHDTGKNYTLSYDNTTRIYDIYRRPISASLLEIGQLVDITFLKGSKHLNSCVVSDSAWVKENVRDFDLISDDQTAKINGEVLHLTNKTVILSEGESLNPEDVLATDTLRVSGIDKEIYSIVVTRGHGYVSLSSDRVNDRSLVGAWIELDKEVIRKITPNMLISAPEGNYSVSINGNGAKFNSEIVVNRNEETVIDTGVVSIEKEKEGLVTFYVTPSDARIFVDGEEVMAEVAHSFVYGKHKIHAMADGYTAQDKILKVAEKEASIFIDLEPNKDADKSSEADSENSEEASTDESIEASYEESIPTEEITSIPEASASASESATDESEQEKSSKEKKTKKNSSASASSSSDENKTAAVDSSAAATTIEMDSSSSTSSSSGSGNSSGSSSSSGNSDSSSSASSVDDGSVGGYSVTFLSPSGAEAYFDGNYVGIIPVSFAKVSGQHMVTLQKDGYETRSYTILVDKEKNNVTYTFPNMTKEKSESSDSGSSKSDDSGKDKSDGDKGGSDSGKTDDSGKDKTDDPGKDKTDDPGKDKTDNPGQDKTDNPGKDNTGIGGDTNPDNPGKDNSGDVVNPDNPGHDSTEPVVPIIPGDNSSEVISAPENPDESGQNDKDTPLDDTGHGGESNAGDNSNKGN